MHHPLLITVLLVGGSNNNYEDNDNDAKDANHEANDDDANDANESSQRQDTGTSSVVIPPKMTECLNKTEHKQIKLLLGKKKLALCYAWGEEYYENPKNAGNVLGCLSL